MLWIMLNRVIFQPIGVCKAVVSVLVEILSDSLFNLNIIIQKKIHTVKAQIQY